MIQYPLEFEVNAFSKSGIQNNWSSSAAETSVVCAIPKEFKGPGGGASPEDFYALSLLNCFIATF